MKLQAIGDHVLLKVVLEKKEEAPSSLPKIIIPTKEHTTPIYEVLDFEGELKGYQVGDHVLLGSFAQEIKFKDITYHICKKEALIAKVLGV